MTTLKEKKKMIETSLEPAERRALLSKSRSRAQRKYQLMIAQHREAELRPGAGKGMEPMPWCECHSRNPCPLDSEINRYLEVNR